MGAHISRTRGLFLVVGLLLGIPLLVAAQYGEGAYGGDSFGMSDSAAPTVSLTAPSTNSTITGTVTVSANASDNIGVVGVQFTLDGIDLGSEDLTSAYSISWNTLSASDGAHTLAAVARDAAGNTQTSSSVTVTVDNSAPILSNGTPSDTLDFGTTNATLTVTTNEAASCKYSTLSSDSYSSMIAFSSTGATSHSHNVSGLQNDTSYVYYVKCEDTHSNANTSSYSISFVVAGDTTSPAVSVTQPANNTVLSGGIAVQATATDDESVAGVQFKLNEEDLGLEDTSSPFSMTWSTGSVADGTYSLVAVARDNTGNIGTSSTITVTVDNTAPTLGGGSSATLPAGTTQANVVFATDEAATCRYSSTSGTSYNSMDSMSSTGDTAHAVTITGLADNTSYTRYFRCRDDQGNTNTSDYTITFSVAAQTVSSGGGGGGGGRSRSGRTRTPTVGSSAPIATTATTPSSGSSLGSTQTIGTTLFRNLSTGSVGEDVRTLQTFLIAEGLLTVQNGPTPLYGVLTTGAIQKYQCVRSIVCAGSPITTGYGAVGPRTRAQLNTEMGGTVPLPSQGGTGFSFTRALQVGSVGTDVQRLQALLIERGHLVLAAPTTYFGTLTLAALQTYQCAKQIACSGTPTGSEYGSTGTRTRATLNADLATIILPTFSAPVVTPAPAPTKVLNADIVALQQFLIDKGFLTLAKPNGIMGADTKTALGNFQFKYGLLFSANDPSYGVLDAKTKAKIDELSKTQ